MLVHVLARVVLLLVVLGGGAGRQADAAQGQGAGARGGLTSGKVPLEKTLRARCQWLRGRTKGLPLAIGVKGALT